MEEFIITHEVKRKFDDIEVVWEVYDGPGKFRHRLRVGDNIGDSTSYTFMAVLIHKGITYCAVMPGTLDESFPTEIPVRLDFGSQP